MAQITDFNAWIDRMLSDNVMFRTVDPVMNEPVRPQDPIRFTDPRPYAEYTRPHTPEFDKLFILWQELEKRVKALEDERKPGQRFLQKKV